MPEAAVHEDRYAGFDEGQIGATPKSWKRPVHAVTETRSMSS
jgi:hypothetical protein